MKKLLKFTTISLLILSFASCEKDDDDGTIASEGNLVTMTAIANTDGWTGSGYMQLMDNCESKSITNTYALPVNYSGVMCINGNDVFIAPGTGGETNLEKYTRTNGKLGLTGKYTLEEYSGACHVAAKGNKLYVSCINIGKIVILDYDNMTFIEEIDISSYGIGDTNPDPGIMIVRNNYLYIALCQVVGGYYPDESRPYSDILIIDTETDEVVKMITTETSGLSYPSRVFEPNSMFMDEDDNIYICCLGSMGAVSGHYAGILKIKADETEFDKSYYFVLNSTAIEGESNYANFISACKYYQNNKLYALVHIPAYYGDPINYTSDRVMAPVEIDLSAQTIKTLGLPYGNFYGKGVAIYNGKTIFGLGTESDIGFYTYDLTTEEVSSSAVIKTEGYPYYLYAFDE